MLVALLSFMIYRWFKHFLACCPVQSPFHVCCASGVKGTNGTRCAVTAAEMKHRQRRIVSYLPSTQTVRILDTGYDRICVLGYQDMSILKTPSARTPRKRYEILRRTTPRTLPHSRPPTNAFVTPCRPTGATMESMGSRQQRQTRQYLLLCGTDSPERCQEVRAIAMKRTFFVICVEHTS